MKVKAKIQFVDSVTGAIYKPGRDIEMDEERANRAISYGYVEYVEAEQEAAEQEAERVAAEQEAARIAAEQEAARIASEQEAARIAAEQEAARIAAEQPKEKEPKTKK